MTGSLLLEWLPIGRDLLFKKPAVHHAPPDCRSSRKWGSSQSFRALQTVDVSPGVGRPRQPVQRGVHPQQAGQWPPVCQHCMRSQLRRHQARQTDAGAQLDDPLACRRAENPGTATGSLLCNPPSRAAARPARPTPAPTSTMRLPVRAAGPRV